MEDIKDKICILIDDMIDTAGTITNVANALKSLGARNVYACCTHGVLSRPAFNRINNSAIEELVMLNTIALPTDNKNLNISLNHYLLHRF